MTTAHFPARPGDRQHDPNTTTSRRRQIMLTPEVSKEVKRLFSAYLHNDRLQIENSLKMLAFWDDLQMLASSDGAGLRNGSAQ